MRSRITTGIALLVAVTILVACGGESPSNQATVASDNITTASGETTDSTAPSPSSPQSTVVEPADIADDVNGTATCIPGSEGAVLAYPPEARGTQGTPEEAVRAEFTGGQLHPTDQLAQVGYRDANRPEVLATRDGRAVLLFTMLDDGHGGWLLDAWISCRPEPK